MARTILIHTEYITLGQLLKYENILESGGKTKDFLLRTKITVNNTPEQRRGKKLYPGDIVDIKNVGIFLVKSNES